MKFIRKLAYSVTPRTRHRIFLGLEFAGFLGIIIGLNYMTGGMAGIIFAGCFFCALAVLWRMSYL